MFSLIIMLISNVGFIMILAYASSRLILHQNSYLSYSSYKLTILYILIFSMFSIISNLTGFEVQPDLHFHSLNSFHIQPDAILANTRVLTISTSALIGGPWVGIAVGSISGLIRYLQGGYVAITYFTSSILIGFISSYFTYWRKKPIFNIPLIELGLLGIFLESLQMLLIYLFAQNPQQAIKYIKFISLPMMVANSLGIMMFFSLVRSLISLDQSTKLFQTQNIYTMARETLPYTYNGLEPKIAKHIAELLKDSMDIEEIIILKEDEILFKTGPLTIDSKTLKKTDIHQVLQETNQTISDHQRQFVHHKHIRPQQSILLLPLQSKSTYLGAVILIFPLNHVMNITTKQIAETILDIFILQFELHQSQQETQLLKDAKIKSLQAQVNPHFLFNAINVIASLCRTKPLEARKQLLELANYFRSNIHGANVQFISIEQELRHVRAFLSIQMARFPNRYHIDYQIDDACLPISIPPFMIQMLVENTVRHAFVGKTQNNIILIMIQKQLNNILIRVEDNGIGMDSETIQNVFSNFSDQWKQGTALNNIHQRLQYLYGEQAKFDINSNSFGTKITITIPI